MILVFLLNSGITPYLIQLSILLLLSLYFPFPLFIIVTSIHNLVRRFGISQLFGFLYGFGVGISGISGVKVINIITITVLTGLLLFNVF